MKLPNSVSALTFMSTQVDSFLGAPGAVAAIPSAEEAPTAPKHIGVRAFVGTFGTSLFIQGCTLAQGIIVARLLGPTGRGEYAAVILWPVALAGVIIGGIYVAIARRAAREGCTAALTHASILLALLTSAVGACAGYFAIPYLLPKDQPGLVPLARIALCVIPLILVSRCLGAIDKGSGNFKRFNITRAVLNPVYLLCLVVIWALARQEVLWFVLALIAGYAASAMVRLAWALPRLFSKAGPLQCVATVREAIPFTFAEAAMEICSRVDSLLILWLLGTENLGLYAVALSAAGVAGSIADASHPVAFAIAARDQVGEGFERIARIFRSVAVVWVAAGTVLAVAMPLLLPLVFGRRFGPAVPLAIVAIAGIAFGGLGMVLDQCLRAQGVPFAGLMGRLVSMLVMLGLGYLGAGCLRTMGVAIAFVVAEGIFLFVIIGKVCRHYRGARPSAFLPRLADLYVVVGRCREIVSATLSHKTQ